jgi:glutathione S-transferase
MIEQQFFFEITSHSLCPMMHSWRIALELSGIDPSNITVTQLAYAARSTWQQVIPTGAGLPFLRCRDTDVLYGALPVLQYFAETVSSQLLPTNSVERVHVRNRALLAMDILSSTRPVLVAANQDHLQTSLITLFAVLQSAENQSWSALPAIDAVLLAAAATILCSQPRILADARWDSLQALRSRLNALSEHQVVLATRAQNYHAEFSAFFSTFGSVFAAAAQ